MRTTVIELMEHRGVKIRDVAEVVLEIQRSYYPELTLGDCIESVMSVVGKREVQHAILTGIALDLLAEQDKLPEPLQGIVSDDDFLYGVDEILALGITNVYGSIGFTNFGYLDKTKPGIIGLLNNNAQRVHTFLDDLVAGIAAAAAAKIAHQRR